MTSLGAKLGALAAATAIIATTALPAYADLGPTTVTQAARLTLQTLAVTTAVDIASPSRDGYSVTKVAAAIVLPNKYTGSAPPSQAFSGSAVLEYASQFVGLVPYGSGNSPTTSFSCDGFTQWVFAGFGIDLPRGADHQARLGVRISQDEAVAGDFVYWPGQHIGIYDGNGGMYDSPTWGRYVQHADKLWGSPLFIRYQG